MSGYRVELRGQASGIRFDEWTPSGLPVFVHWDDALEIAHEARAATGLAVRVIGEAGYIVLPSPDRVTS